MIQLQPKPIHSAGPSQRLDDALLRRIVESFYGRARRDSLLAPIFDERVADWPAHFATMTDFWSKAVLGTRRYSGQPFEAHRRIRGLEPAHFERWLTLFAETVDELCEPGDAELLAGLARRMGDGMSLALRLSRQDLAEVTR